MGGKPRRKPKSIDVYVAPDREYCRPDQDTRNWILYSNKPTEHYTYFRGYWYGGEHISEICEDYARKLGIDAVEKSTKYRVTFTKIE